MRFSIVVPVFKVEEYLDFCVESLLNQTFSDFEVILVDDCSPDKCPALCDAWAERDRRVRVIHKSENQGLGFARNTGIEAAQGEYILFVDSDDSLSPETLDACDRALSAETDILVFGMKLCYENEKGERTWEEAYLPETFLAVGKAEIADMFSRLSRNRVFPYACNKVYCREFLLSAGAKFEKTKLIEDFLFNIELFGAACQIEAIPAALYRYRKPAHETLASRYSPEFFELSKRKFTLEEAFLQNCQALSGAFRHQIHCGYVKHLISAVIRNRAPSSGMCVSSQKMAIQTMFSDPLTVRVLQEMKPEGAVYRVICSVIRKKRVTAFWLICFAVDLMRRFAKPLYRHFA